MGRKILHLFITANIFSNKPADKLNSIFFEIYRTNKYKRTCVVAKSFFVFLPDRQCSSLHNVTQKLARLVVSLFLRCVRWILNERVVQSFE